MTSPSILTCPYCQAKNRVQAVPEGEVPEIGRAHV